MRHLILVVLLVCSFQAQANLCDDVRIGSLVSTNHVGGSEELNEDQQPSLFIACNGWTLGYYDNSFSTEELPLRSYVFAYERDIGSVGPLEFSWMAGAVNGYPDDVTVLRKPDGTRAGLNVDADRWLPWFTINVKVGWVKLWSVPGIVTGVGLEYRF